MSQRIANIAYWLAAFVLIACCIYLGTVNSNIKLFLLSGTFFSLLCFSLLSKKYSAGILGVIVYDVSKALFLFLGIIILIIVSLRIVGQIPASDFETQMCNMNVLLPCLVYIVYLIFIFMFADSERSITYTIFGCLYIICIMLKMVSTDANDLRIANFLVEGDSEYKVEAYKLIRDACLDPIKEAVLTFIIFDTAIVDKKTKTCKMNNQEENCREYEDDAQDAQNCDGSAGEKRESIYNVRLYDYSNGKEKEYLIRIYR